MDKILLRYTEYNEPHKPLTNSDVIINTFKILLIFQVSKIIW